MKAFYKDMFEYQHHYNKLLIEEFKNHGNKLPEKSFPLFCHVLNAHQIWNARIMNTPAIGVRDIHALSYCGELNELNFKNTSGILNSRDLNEKIQYKTSRGEAFENSIKEILFHVSNHATHHRAQILSDFRQSGITPLITDYIFYKR
jgi:uncharacterized damage-inducible protein DinB